MTLHGAGAGFDLDPLFAHRPSEGFRIRAPAGPGHLRIGFTAHASPAARSDALAGPLASLPITQGAVDGAGAPGHPDRCAQRERLVPVAKLPGRDREASGTPRAIAVDAVSGSDAALRALASRAPGQMSRNLRATEPVLRDRLEVAGRWRAKTPAEHLPNGDGTPGLRKGGRRAAKLRTGAREAIGVPGSILSRAEDVMGTAATARLPARRVAGARRTIGPEGGHVRRGHDADMTRRVTAFARIAALRPTRGSLQVTWTRVVVTAFGGPETLELEEVDTLPEPAAGEVRIRVLVTSAAFTDVMIRKGMYPDVKEKPPFALGYDLVGIVDAAGPGARRFRAGDRVADLTTIGGYADYICLPEDRLTPVPEGVSDVDALGMILSGVTPHQMLHRVARAQPGESLLIHGAGGAVGTTMLQLARDAGIAAFGTDIAAKHDLIRALGATPIDAGASGPALREAVGGGVDHAFDPLGGESLSRSLHALKPGGMLIAYGFQNAVMGKGGSIPMDFVRLKLWDWLPNGHATAFYAIGAMRRRHPDWFREDLATLFAMRAEGRIAPVVAEVMPLAEARRAHERIEAGEVAGKLVLRVGEA